MADDHPLRKQLIEDGFVVCRGALPETTLHKVLDDFEARLALRERHRGMAVAPTELSKSLHDRSQSLGKRLIELETCFPGEQGVVYDVMSSAPALHASAADPALIAIVQSLLSSSIAVHPRLILLMSLPERNWHLSAWHQDYFYNAGPTSTLTVWAPLQKTTEKNGSLLLARGSQRLGRLEHAEHDHGFKTKWLSLSLKTVQGFDDIVEIEAEPGDIVLFDALLAHSGRVNRSDSVRFTLNLRYQDLTDPEFLSGDWRLAQLEKARAALGRSETLSSTK